MRNHNLPRRFLFSGDAETILKLIATGIYLIGIIPVCVNQTALSEYAGSIEFISPLMLYLFDHALPAYLIVFGICLLFLWFYPLDKRQVTEVLKDAGIRNHSGNPPEFLRRKRNKANPQETIWVFKANAVSLKTWWDNAENLQYGLGLYIRDIRAAKGNTRILLYTQTARGGIPGRVNWKPGMLDKDDFVLSLGEGLFGPVKIDLSKTPHVLLGGSTGSGKSVLLKLMLMQSWQKGAEIIIADFKGGVDFSPAWHEKCRMCFAPEDLLNVLNDLVDELEARKELFRENGCPNLTEYNRRAKEKLPRMIFACDEVAEVLDKTGLSKELKELVSQIENRLSVIARQGRAFGIHLILATQRPDATVIPGQIRSNLDVRICGKADNILSQIILDNASAGELIPKYSQGRFLTGDGTLFQAYWFDERTW